jgi:hypothetical protein
MPIEGKDALDLMTEIDKKEEEKAAEQMAQAKARAAASGKEPFDYDRLKGMCQTIYGETQYMTEDRRATYFEQLYYVEYPKVMTLAELAEK